MQLQVTTSTGLALRLLIQECKCTKTESRGPLFPPSFNATGSPGSLWNDTYVFVFPRLMDTFCVQMRKTTLISLIISLESVWSPLLLRSLSPTLPMMHCSTVKWRAQPLEAQGVRQRSVSLSFLTLRYVNVILLYKKFCVCKARNIRRWWHSSSNYCFCLWVPFFFFSTYRIRSTLWLWKIWLLLSQNMVSMSRNHIILHRTFKVYCFLFSFIFLLN